MVQLSVVICSHNPRSQYLDRVLSALRLQSLPYEQWELLLVDNASQLALSARFDLSWHPNGRHVLENELGLAAARRRGMTDALSEVLIFVDDDNLLAENYLSEALRIGQEWPALGTWGAGTIIPEFERQPAGYLKPYLASLALRENTKAYWGNVLFCSNSTPCGAGMCVRAAVAKEYCRLQSSASIQITDRKGGMLVGHGDYEIAYVGCSLGFGMGVFPDLKITHLIPQERVSDRYILGLAVGNEISGGLLEYKWIGVAPPNPFSSKSILSMIKNVALTGNLFQRRHHLAQVRGRIAARRAVANVGNKRSS